jgi:hypothetical protein
MKFLYLIPLVSLLLSSCQNAPRSFSSMSEAELYAYNQGKPVRDQVVCLTQNTTSSHIRKRRCRTYGTLQSETERSVMALEVINSGGPSNPGLGRRN